MFPIPNVLLSNRLSDVVKNLVPFEKEIVTNTDGGVQIGDVISYKLTGKVADVTGFDEYNYAVADTMGAGLTYKNL